MKIILVLNLEKSELRTFLFGGPKKLGLFWDRCGRILESLRCRLEGICMDKEYLPGDVRDRICDLSKEFGIGQNEIARQIGMSQGAFSRFMSGFTDKLSYKYVINIAELFGVSTDFLLGVVNNPTRINYDATKLGLTVEAAKRLYHEDVNAEVVNLLLTNDEFAQVTFLIKHYLDNTTARGYAAGNTMLDTLSQCFAEMSNDAAAKTARDMKCMSVPMYQENLTKIQTVFMSAVEAIKEESGTKLSHTDLLTKEITQQIFDEAVRIADATKPRMGLTWKSIVSAMITVLAERLGIKRKRLKTLEEGMLLINESEETDK